MVLHVGDGVLDLQDLLGVVVGDFAVEFGAGKTGVLVATLDLARAEIHRAGMGFFRDRRPQLYGRIAQDI